MEKHTSNLNGLAALSPLFVFVGLYLVSSIAIGDFYKVPISVAFMLASVYAVAIGRGETVKERVAVFSRGAGTPGIMLMLWIFILAGAFAASAKAIGSVDSTVALMLTVLPNGMLLPGLFLATCFVSMAVGTSVGSIVALVPIAAGLANATDSNAAMYVAAVVGGAFFGDNLSFISDTTIVATSTQGCRMSDKFRTNVRIALPAAIATFILYALLGDGTATPPAAHQLNWPLVVPYAAVIACAVCGMDVMLVLVLGIVLTGGIGLSMGLTDVYSWLGTMGDGIAGMSELIIITMLAGGMFEVVRHDGGINFLLRAATARVKGKRGAEAVISVLVAAVDVCTANNTVAIITVGGLARQISEKFNIDPRRAASLLDTASCVAQGLIPYGAQMLMAAGLTNIASTRIMSYAYYPCILGVVAAAAIVFRFPRSYAR